MSTRRPKSVLDQDRYTAELSTGQLVIGVCILLMFGLGCFLLGVLIGKFDPTLRPGVEQRADDPATESSPPEIKMSELPPAPVSTAPATTTASPVLPPEMRAPANILREDPAAVSGETPPPAAANEPTPPAVETVAPAAAPPGDAADGPSVSESVAATAERNRIAPPSAQPQAVDAAPAEAAPPPAAAPATEETGATLTPWKGYGVQIVAVAKDRAEGVRKDLESKSSYKARVLPHARNDLYRVVVGPYADQPAATRARDDLRARGFRDAFVLTLQ